MRAREYYALGTKLLDYEERRAAFQKTIELCPSFADAHVNLADALEHLAARTIRNPTLNREFVNRAFAEYRAAIRYNGRSFLPYLGLAHLYEAAGMYGESKNALFTASHSKPQDFRVNMGLKRLERLMAFDKRFLLIQREDGLVTSVAMLASIENPPVDSGMRTLGPEPFTIVKTGSPSPGSPCFVKFRLRFINIPFEETIVQMKDSNALRQLDEIASAMSSLQLKAHFFLVDCHTAGPTGTGSGTSEGLSLSQARALFIKEHLVNKSGISPERIVARGFGGERPWHLDDDPNNGESLARVEIVLLCPVQE